ncbi:hypothetical protein SKAU_G00162380 [Synaphobranchus kaupii]|uniref:Uncharacterized protein n=1 Tax=Synaphobranchus kaupii TaxID=118154 RepID=A0A9Q1FIY6_SYNKA|nr:hypothetical protein SKAU_G00162380 [Synaphobranchus kaupii]
MDGAQAWLEPRAVHSRKHRSANCGANSDLQSSGRCRTAGVSFLLGPRGRGSAARDARLTHPLPPGNLGPGGAGRGPLFCGFLTRLSLRCAGESLRAVLLGVSRGPLQGLCERLILKDYPD